MRLKDIANFYKVSVGAVVNKLNTKNLKSPYPDRSFNRVDMIPVEHRDTGNDVSHSTVLLIGSGAPRRIPKDLRMEWRLDRWNPGDD